MKFVKLRKGLKLLSLLGLISGTSSFFQACKVDDQAGSESASQVKNGDNGLQSSTLVTRAKIKTGSMAADCWDQLGGGQWISMPAGTELAIDLDSKKKQNDFPFLRDSVSGYFGYEVSGNTRFFKSAKVMTKGELGTQTLKTKFSSCWIEEKYLAFATLQETQVRKPTDVNYYATQITLNKNLTFSYLKSAPQAPAQLLANSATEAKAETQLSSLPSEVHNPSKACLIVPGTKLALTSIDRKIGLRDGHLFVVFGGNNGSPDHGVVLDLKSSTDWQRADKIRDHWKSLADVFSKHPGWTMGAGAVDPTKDYPTCFLNKADGAWIKAEDFDWAKTRIGE